MYLNHFGLREAPFRITPHTDFFFEGANRGATLEALLYAITQDEGIVKVTGEVGSGKTMLCRVLMERLPQEVETIYLANPSLGRDEIMLAILDDLKVPSTGERSSVILRALQDRLVELYAAGRKVVVLIDEAHAMPVETLEEIRLLSNLESKRHKLLQIVLFGQQELDEVLATPQMRQLKERIVHSFRLEPLVRSDIGTYLTFRMRLAGYKGPDVFSEGALRLIADASEGLTRRVNILADKSLLAAFSESGYQILPRHVNAAIADSEFARLRSRAPMPLSTLTLAIAAVALIASGAAAAMLAVYLTIKRAPTVAQDAGATAQTAAAPAGARSAAETAPPPPAEPANDAVSPAPGAGSANSPRRATGTPPAAMATSPDAPKVATSLLDRRQDATRQWLADAPGSTFTLQLLTADVARAAEIDLWLSRLPEGVDVEKVFIYNSLIRGAPRFSVLYGAFASRAAAVEALTRLPKELREGRPIVRTVGAIRTDRNQQ